MTQPRGSQQWKILALILVGVVVVVGAVYAFMEYQRNRPSAPVRDLTVEVAAGGETLAVPTYTVCELDVECPGGDAPTMPLHGQREVTLTVPAEIAKGSWRLLTIYDDPAANSEHILQSGESTQEVIQAVTDSGAKLVVAEVSALAVEKSDDGEEVPVIATWSLGFE